MPNYPEETADVSFPCPGRCVWNEETQTVDFVSCVPAEEGASRRRTQANVNFTGLQQRAEWLTELRTLDHRGRQSLRKSVSSAHLKAYRSSVMKKRGDLVTIDDVKQVAVRLLQENYSLPIPSCFLAVLRRKELDDVLAALLLYLSCFFEHKFLENKPKPLMEIDTVTEHQMVETLAKKEIAKKKLAVCYFSLLFMDLEIKQGQHKPYYKSQILPSSTEWLLDGCLYSFFCYVAWVTFGRKDLRDIQEEVGHLMYSDTFNMAVTSDGDSRTTSTAVNSSLKPEEDDPKETGYNGKFTHRTSQRHPALSSIANQRSPLMVSLFPSPKERSPHLFLGSRARRQSPLQAEHCDTKALTEQLNQQLASVSFGILGQSLKQFSYTTLIPHGEPKNNREKVIKDDEFGGDFCLIPCSTCSLQVQ